MRWHRLGLGLAVTSLMMAASPAFAASSVDLQKTVYVGQNDGASCPGVELAVGTLGLPITYCFRIQNTGTVELTSIQLSDGGIGLNQAVLGPGETLAPGASKMVYFNDTISFDLLNTASITALPGPATDNDTARVDRVTPSLIFQKTVYTGHNNGIGCPGGESVTGPIGSAITYCFLVRNTGDTHLGDIGIADPDLGITEANMTRLLGNAPLPPTGPNTLVYYYQTTVTTDMLNTATVTANPVLSGGGDLPGLDDVVVSDTASVDEFTIPTTTFTTTTSTSTTTTTIQVCSCSTGIPFMAGNKATLGVGTAIEGSFGVNNPAGLLRLAPFATLSDNTTAYGDRVKLADHASVYNLQTNVLSTAPTTSIRGEATGLASLPLTQPYCAFTLPPQCGSGQLDVASGTVELSAGNYGNVRIGVGTTLHLTGVGRFGFCSLTVLDDGQIFADQQVTIDVVGNVNIGTGAVISTGSGMPLIMNVGGAKFRVSNDAEINAAITAPVARMKLKQYGRINGCLCTGLLKTASNTDLICVGD